MKQFIKHNLINFNATILIGLGNWLLGFLIIKLLDANYISEFNAFIGLLQIFLFPATWINLMTNRMGVSIKNASVRFIISHKNLAIISSMIFVILLAGSTAYSELSAITFAILFGLILISLAIGYFRGVLQHELEFTKVAIVGICDVVIKLAIFCSFIYLGLPQYSLFAAIVVQTISTALLTFFFSRGLNSSKIQESLTSVSILSFVYGFYYIFFTNIDLIMARKLLSVDANAHYIGILQLIKLFMFSAKALIDVLLPSAIKAKNRGELKSISLVTSGMIISGAAALILILTFGYNPLSQIFNISDVSLSLIVTFIVYAGIFALAQIPVTILFVKIKVSLVWLLIFMSILQLGLYFTFGHDLAGFINVFGATSITLFISAIIITWKNLRH